MEAQQELSLIFNLPGHRLILFGFLPQSSKTKAVAAMPSVAHARTPGPRHIPVGSGDLAVFRRRVLRLPDRAGGCVVDRSGVVRRWAGDIAGRADAGR